MFSNRILKQNRAPFMNKTSSFTGLEKEVAENRSVGTRKTVRVMNFDTFVDHDRFLQWRLDFCSI